MSESLQGGDGFNLHEELGTPEFQNIEARDRPEHPLLSHQESGQLPLGTPAGFVQFFRRREEWFPGYKELAVEVIGALEMVSQCDENMPEEELFGYRIGLKPSSGPVKIASPGLDTLAGKRAVVGSNIIRLYDFEDLPASRAFVEMTLHIADARPVYTSEDERGLGARLYSVNYPKDNPSADLVPNTAYIVERIASDDLGRYKTLEIFRSEPPEFWDARTNAEVTESEEENQPCEVFRRKAERMVNYFMEKEAHGACPPGYSQLANSAAKIVRELARGYDEDAAAITKPLLLKPIQTELSDAQLYLLTDEEYKQYQKDSDSLKIYDDNIPEPTRDLIILSNELLEDSETHYFKNPGTNKEYWLTRGWAENTQVCLVEERGNDGLGVYLAWQAYTGMPQQFYEDHVQQKLSAKAIKRELDKFRGELTELPETPEPARVKRALRRLKNKQDRGGA